MNKILFFLHENGQFSYNVKAINRVLYKHIGLDFLELYGII